MALKLIRTSYELRARHRQAYTRDVIEADEYLRQIGTEIEGYRDIDQTAKNYLSYMLRNIGRSRWLHVRKAVSQYVAWKWMLGHSDADTFAAIHPDPRHTYIYLRDQIESGEWDRLTKEALEGLR